MTQGTTHLLPSQAEASVHIAAELNNHHQLPHPLYKEKKIIWERRDTKRARRYLLDEKNWLVGEMFEDLTVRPHLQNVWRQHDWAPRFDVCRETINRVMKTAERQGWVVIRKFRTGPARYSFHPVLLKCKEALRPSVKRVCLISPRKAAPTHVTSLKSNIIGVILCTERPPISFSSPLAIARNADECPLSLFLPNVSNISSSLLLSSSLSPLLHHCLARQSMKHLLARQSMKHLLASREAWQENAHRSADRCGDAIGDASPSAWFSREVGNVLHGLETSKNVDRAMELGYKRMMDSWTKEKAAQLEASLSCEEPPKSGRTDMDQSDIPAYITSITCLNLSLAGQVALIRYPEEAIAHAVGAFASARKRPGSNYGLFDLFCRQYCTANGAFVNVGLAKQLRDALGISTSASYTSDTPPGSELPPRTDSPHPSGRSPLSAMFAKKTSSDVSKDMFKNRVIAKNHQLLAMGAPLLPMEVSIMRAQYQYNLGLARSADAYLQSYIDRYEAEHGVGSVQTLINEQPRSQLEITMDQIYGEAKINRNLCKVYDKRTRVAQDAAMEVHQSLLSMRDQTIAFLVKASEQNAIAIIEAYALREEPEPIRWSNRSDPLDPTQSACTDASYKSFDAYIAGVAAKMKPNYKGTTNDIKANAVDTPNKNEEAPTFEDLADE